MSSTETLTSLAMLKVHVDRGGDYLDYLRPFILQVLVDQKPDPVTDRIVRDHLRTYFGLDIPERAIQIMLKRISRKHPLKRDMGVYRILGDLPNPGISAEKSRAERHISAVISGLIDFSKTTGKPIKTTEEAVTAICSFLSEFNIPCLRAYLRGTAIPNVDGKSQSQIVIVSEYVLHQQRTDPERFESFSIMVQGHMLANALLCPDLKYASATYKGVTFYLDTPLLIQRLGLEGAASKAAVKNLIALLRNLGGKVAAFSHSRDELDRVIRGAADFIDTVDGRGPIVMEARQQGTSKSDLLLLAGRVDEHIRDAGIEVLDTPKYIERLQIDHVAFEKVLDDEISYFNPRAKEYDINSVRSIYVLRDQKTPTSIENCKAVFVTSNSAFADAAYAYGQRHEESREVSSVITDFSLANMAWLKAPLGAPSIPITEVLAFSYAALRPSSELLDKYLAEIDKLEKGGKISERDHQLLRSSAQAREEVMRLTLGDDKELTEATVTETLRRVTAEIKKEEDAKLSAEQKAHQQARDALASSRAETLNIRQRIYWRCARKAKLCAWIVSVGVTLLLFAGFLAGLGIKSDNRILGWMLIVGACLTSLIALIARIVGFKVTEIHDRVYRYIHTWLLRREAIEMGIVFETVVP